MSEVTISLLHATHRAGASALARRDRWLALAARPELVEYHFAFDDDDDVSVAAIGGEALPNLGGRVTAVRNWNWAARRSTGDLMMVVADDLQPAEQGWDNQLRRVCGALDATKVPFAVKVRDGEKAAEHLMRHPVVSRAYYAAYGLFDDGYFGIGADNDFTLSAHCYGLVLDGRGLVLDHEHPTHGAPPTASHSRMSAPAERDDGKARFERRWPLRRRRIWYRYFKPRRGQRRVSRIRLLARSGMTRLGWARAFVPNFVRHRVRSLVGKGLG